MSSFTRRVRCCTLERADASSFRRSSLRWLAWEPTFCPLLGCFRLRALRRDRGCCEPVMCGSVFFVVSRLSVGCPRHSLASPVSSASSIAISSSDSPSASLACVRSRSSSTVATSFTATASAVVAAFTVGSLKIGSTCCCCCVGLAGSSPTSNGVSPLFVRIGSMSSLDRSTGRLVVLLLSLDPEDCDVLCFRMDCVWFGWRASVFNRIIAFKSPLPAVGDCLAGLGSPSCFASWSTLAIAAADVTSPSLRLSCASAILCRHSA